MISLYFDFGCLICGFQPRKSVNQSCLFPAAVSCLFVAFKEHFNSDSGNLPMPGTWGFTNPLSYSEIKLSAGSITEQQQTVQFYVALCCRSSTVDHSCAMMLFFSEMIGEVLGHCTLLLATGSVCQNQCISCSGHSNRLMIHILKACISVLI